MGQTVEKTERDKMSELIGIMLDSNFYLEMNVYERLNLIKVMLSSMS